MSESLKGWSSAQKHVVAASYLGWTLDAFDFFLMVFVIKDVAHDFGVVREDVAWAVTLTLALRAVGAFIFGRLADRFGRRPILMADVAIYSVLGFSTAFAPNLVVFLIIRSLFGIAMGGEWGIGASLTMESVKPEARGFVSGLLQSGYPSGYLLASVAYGLLYTHIGWRGLFMISVIPALLVLYIRRHVPESPGWSSEHARTGTLTNVLRNHWGLALYAILLMTAFNFFSHGTQDIYPTFLQVQHKFPPAVTGSIAVIYNIGAILGGWTFGFWSQSFGRRRTIVVAALLAIPVTYLWAFSETAAMLTVGAFLMQFFVQGAWGVIPAHLNELSPVDARGTFPGTVYQLGNFIASYNAVLQTRIAAANHENYSIALASVAVIAALVIAIFTMLGREAREAKLA
ncbi:MAG: MFS transporter [Alphaproteobacteria bacterium]|nr:MFS transporter [Alphaproteobacteria bacterium]MBL6936656.1 MFS transporter [Alphaproteobacteria bacterium]MBL7097425.1 MFS transporter [Alphaproteobacteria bacterium]